MLDVRNISIDCKSMKFLTYVFMYGGPSTSFLRYEPLKNDVTIFDPFSGLKTRFRLFPTPGDYLFVKMKN